MTARSVSASGAASCHTRSSSSRSASSSILRSANVVSGVILILHLAAEEERELRQRMEGAVACREREREKVDEDVGWTTEDRRGVGGRIEFNVEGAHDEQGNRRNREQGVARPDAARGRVVDDVSWVRAVWPCGYCRLGRPACSWNEEDESVDIGGMTWRRSTFLGKQLNRRKFIGLTGHAAIVGAAGAAFAGTCAGAEYETPPGSGRKTWEAGQERVEAQSAATETAVAGARIQ